MLRRRRDNRDLLVLDEVRRRLRAFSQRPAGIRPILLANVIGTDSRGGDFDRDFRPRRAGVLERRKSVEAAFPDGAYPPIAVYQLGDAYFVLDGHHRVALARERGAETIDADITELTARWHLPADADIVEIIHVEQAWLFSEESGLAIARPQVEMRLSRLAGYLELLENVQVHGYHLMLAAGRVAEPSEIAADWYDRVYAPALEAIWSDGLDRAFPDATDADLFLRMHRRRRDLFHDCGCPPLDATVRQATEEVGADRPRGLRRLVSR